MKTYRTSPTQLWATTARFAVDREKDMMKTGTPDQIFLQFARNLQLLISGFFPTMRLVTL